MLSKEEEEGQNPKERMKFTHSTIFFTGFLPSHEQEKRLKEKQKAPVTCRIISSMSMESQKKGGENINSEEEMGINE